MTSPTAAPRRPRTARPKLDAIAAAAVELAREALLEVTEPGQVGEHLRAEASGERLVTHIFECTMPGYRGWSWVVVLARASRAKFATVAETALLPGEDAILAPDWEPWSERLKPSDVGADDLLPYRDQDERLEQGYEATGDEEADRVAQWELGLGRARVLSQEGRGEAAERWHAGEFGPRQTSGRGRRGTVAANCSSCGFLTKLSGSLRSEFGVCTNEWSPADGRVVHLKFGCGAHSETGQQDEDRETSRSSGVIVDELDVEFQKDSAPVDEKDEQSADAAEPIGPTTADENAGATAGQPAGAMAEEPATAEPAAAEPTTAEPATAEPAAVTEEAAAETEPAAAEDAAPAEVHSEEPAPILVEPAGAGTSETLPAQGSLLDQIPEADSPEDDAPAAEVSEETPTADA